MIHSAFRYASGARVYALNAVKRHLATISEQQPSPPLNPKPTVPPVPSKMTKTGALRPHMGITVRPDHGLYHFFRKVPKEDSPLGYEYLPYEPMDESVLGASYVSHFYYGIPFFDIFDRSLVDNCRVATEML